MFSKVGFLLLDRAGSCPLVGSVERQGEIMNVCCLPSQAQVSPQTSGATCQTSVERQQPQSQASASRAGLFVVEGMSL